MRKNFICMVLIEEISELGVLLTQIRVRNVNLISQFCLLRRYELLLYQILTLTLFIKKKKRIIGLFIMFYSFYRGANSSDSRTSTN
jgi:hypothetical protein